MVRVIWKYHSRVLGPFASELLSLSPLTAESSLFRDADLLGLPEPVFRRPPLALRAELATLTVPKETAENLDLAAFHHVFAPDLEAAERIRQRLLESTLVALAEIQQRLLPAVSPDRLRRARRFASTTGFLSLAVPRTPSFEKFQEYLAAAPEGIGIHAPRRLAGGRGRGVRILDVESGWSFDHEDLRQHQIGVIDGFNDGSDHGTAVLGILSADANGLGVVGIAPQATVGALSATYSASLGKWNAAGAIEKATRFLGAGDVLVLEMHAPGPHTVDIESQRGFLPVEYWAAERAAIQVAVARGLYVVEAAGNGGEDLDHPDYRGRLDREADTEAFLVGGGASAWQAAPRSRIWWSNFGSRLDLQGWGEDIVTTGGREDGYHDLYDHPEASRCYTQTFGGTSGATPIVAGAVALLAGVRRARGNPPLSPREMRALLVDTGIPQLDGPGGSATQRIGPLPNLEAAIAALGTD